MKKTRGTEKTIDINDNINVVIGSVDKNNPKSIYLKFSAWANTIDYDENLEYKSVISKLNKEIKRYIYLNLDKNLFKENRTMVDMDMRESGIGDNKCSFMSFEVTLYQTNSYLLDTNVINNELIKLSRYICDNILEKYSYFNFFKDKKYAKIELLET